MTSDRTSAHAPATVPRRTWFTGWLFVVGSALFAAGVIIDVATSQERLAAWTYVVGSIFFTAAALLQLLTSREQLHLSTADGVTSRIARRARNTDWSASALQLVGTVFFNVNTVRAATLEDLSTLEENQLVWHPDAFGSTLFLVSSAIAFAPEVRARRHGHARGHSWQMAALNLVGSVFFGLAAIGAYLLPTTGDAINVRWANAGTFLGALCFLVAAVLLTRPTQTDAAALR